MAVLIPLIMIGVFVAVIVTAWKSAARLRREFPAWATGLGWVALPTNSWTTPPEATGDYAGRRGRAYAYSTGSGKSRQSWSAIELVVNGAAGLELQFARQGIGTKISEWFGVK